MRFITSTLTVLAALAMTTYASSAAEAKAEAQATAQAKAEAALKYAQKSYPKCTVSSCH